MAEGRNELAARANSHHSRSATIRNYTLGELFASQIHHHMAKTALGGACAEQLSYFGERRVGEYLQREIFDRGNTMPWNELTKTITGEPLNANAFAQDIK